MALTDTPVADADELRVYTAATTALKPLAYSVKQVLDLVPISRSQLYVEIAAGKLTVTKIGARTLFTPQALEN